MGAKQSAPKQERKIIDYNQSDNKKGFTQAQASDYNGGFEGKGIKKGSPAAKMQTPDTKKGSTFAEFQRQGAKNGGGIGFNQLGAERGEFAAIHQQKIGNVPKGSDFSKIQQAVYSCDDK